jgi:ribonucleoside-triphosphate reductase
VILFQRRPFLALLAGGLAPLPFYPLRCLVVLARYPLWRYLAAIALSRTPRFYLLALLGVSSILPDSVWVALSVVLVVAFLAPLLSWGRRPRPEGEAALPEADPTRA